MGSEKLTDMLIRFDRIAKAILAPRPGSNQMSLLGMQSKDGSAKIYGPEIEALHRAGLLEATPYHLPCIVPRSEADGGIDADHLWKITPAGRSALSTTTKGEGHE